MRVRVLAGRRAPSRANSSEHPSPEDPPPPSPLIMLKELEALWSRLGDPEFAGLVLEPVFVWGIGIGLVVLLFAILFKEGKSQKLGLVLIVLSCLAAVPFTHFRMEAAPRIAAVAQAAGLEAANARWQSLQWVYLALAALATLTFFLSKGGKAGLWLTLLTIAASAAAVVLGLWLFAKDAEVFHPTQRSVAATASMPPPVVPPWGDRQPA